MEKTLIDIFFDTIQSVSVELKNNPYFDLRSFLFAFKFLLGVKNIDFNKYDEKDWIEDIKKKIYDVEKNESMQEEFLIKGMIYFVTDYIETTPEKIIENLQMYIKCDNEEVKKILERNLDRFKDPKAIMYVKNALKVWKEKIELNLNEYVIQQYMYNKLKDNNK